MGITKLSTRRSLSFVYLGIVFVLAISYLLWFLGMHHAAEILFADINAARNANEKPLIKYVRVSKHEPAIMVLRDRPLKTSSIYVYVSNAHPFQNDFIPHDLVSLSVAHAWSDEPPQLTIRAASALQQLFAAAKKAHQPLIVSSAYRSKADQQKLLSSYRAQYGEAMARKYVSRPGSSEHQTGLAVDINTYTSVCEQDVSQCNISATTSMWLEKHAPRYGFIIRYPKGKEAITGISYEPWHLRYIGNAASILAASGLTYDEFAKKADPSLFAD